VKLSHGRSASFSLVEGSVESSALRTSPPQAGRAGTPVFVSNESLRVCPRRSILTDSNARVNPTADKLTSTSKERFCSRKRHPPTVKTRMPRRSPGNSDTKSQRPISDSSHRCETTATRLQPFLLPS